MGAEEQVFSVAGGERDDLEIISGIGPKLADALHQLGILRFEDLAQYTPQDLAQAFLEQTGVRVPSERIETNKWIEQARERAQYADLERPLVDKEIKAAKDPSHVPSNRKPEQHAAFSVFFDYELDKQGERTWQTHVYDNASGVEGSLPGIEPAVWVNWILERAKLPIAIEPVPTQAEAAAPPTPISLGDARVEILGVRVSESISWPEQGEKRLEVEVRFQVSGTGAGQLTAGRIPFQVKVCTIDVESEASTLVASQVGQLEPQVLEYTSRQEFPMPELGSYEVRTGIELLRPGEMVAYHQGPTFGVVPCLSRYTT